MYTKNEKGQAIIILVIAVVALLAFAALAIDAGNAYTVRREAQNAADAGALAGARQLVLECAKQGQNPGPIAANVDGQVGQMVQANKSGATLNAAYVNNAGTPVGPIDPSLPVPCSCALGSNRAEGVEVTVNTQAQSFLAGLIGQPSFDIQVTAKARFGSVTDVGPGLYPITRRNLPLEFNQTFTLRLLDDADTLPGNFGWLTWDGQNNIPALETSLTPPGNSQIYYNPGEPADWVANYNDHVIAVGKWVQGAPGNKNSSQVRAKLDWFISTQTPMIIPFYDEVAGQGSHSNYKVASFAAFQLQSYDFTGNDKSATGKFIKWVTNGDWDPTVTCESEGGVYSVKLTP